jgi:hypothetical protein
MFRAVFPDLKQAAGRFVQIAQNAEYFPGGFRRLAEFRFLERVASQLTEMLQIGAGVVAGHFAEDLLILQ